MPNLNTIARTRNTKEVQGWGEIYVANVSKESTILIITKQFSSNEVKNPAKMVFAQK